MHRSFKSSSLDRSHPEQSQRAIDKKMEDGSHRPRASTTRSYSSGTVFGRNFAVTGQRRRPALLALLLVLSRARGCCMMAATL